MGIFRRRFLACALLILIANVVGAQETRTVAPEALAALLENPFVAEQVHRKPGDVVVVEYFDYNCPICRALEPALRKLLASDPKVRLVRKDWPIFGDGSVYAAYASFAASQEGRYQAAHDALITSTGDLDSKPDVLSVLKAAGFDSAKIESEIAQHQKAYDNVLDRARREAQALGLRGTPGLIVGNQLVLGRADYESLERLVSRARADR